MIMDHYRQKIELGEWEDARSAYLKDQKGGTRSDYRVEDEKCLGA